MQGDLRQKDPSQTENVESVPQKKGAGKPAFIKLLAFSCPGVNTSDRLSWSWFPKLLHAP